MTYLILGGTHGFKRASFAFAEIPSPSQEAVEKREDAIQKAIATLGERWVLHDARRIKKGEYTQPEVHKCDVGATFAREWAKIEQAKSIIVRA